MNKNLEVVDSLSNVGELGKIAPIFEDEYVQDLATGSETYTFKTMANSRQSQHLSVGNYIAFLYKKQYKLFHITQIDEEHNEDFIKTVYCEMSGIELINEIVRPMKVVNTNAKSFLQSILQDTSWSVGAVTVGLTDIFDYEVSDYNTVYSLIQEVLVGTYGLEVSFSVEIKNNRIVNKFVNIYKERGSNKGFRFSYSSNLSSIVRTVDTSSLCTALIGVGKNDVDFKNIETSDKPLGQDFIENESAYRIWSKNGKHILGVFKAETDSPQELLKLTREELTKRSEPKVKYELSVETLGKDEVSIGDTVFIVDNEFNPPIQLTGRVSELRISFCDSNSNECVLSNFKEVASNITKDLQELVDSKFPIGSGDIQNGAIDGDKLKPGQIIQGTHLFANSVTADKIMSDSIKTQHLAAGSITADKAIIAEGAIGSLQIGKGVVDTIHIKTGAIDSAKIDKLAVGIMHLQDGCVGTLKVEDAAITNAKIGELAVGTLNVQDAAITNAKIKELSADKITSGQIDTDRLTANVITAINASIGKIESDKISVGELDAGAITTGSLDTNLLTANVIKAINASFDTATIDSAKIGSLDASKITSGTIDADLISASVIKAIELSSQKISADFIDVDSIKVGSIDASAIVSGTIDAQRLAASVVQAIEMSAQKISATNINANGMNIGRATITESSITDATITKGTISNATIEGATINNAIINKLDASKITSGTIDISKVGISSLSGNLSISNNTIQISDTNNVVRVQLGEDATKDYGLIIANSSGEIMWDLTGASKFGIQDDAITENKIKDGEVSPSKLQIDELWASEGFIKNFSAQKIHADQINTGKIKSDYLDITGLVSFDTLDEDMTKFFTPPVDENGNPTKTWINGASIYTGSITGQQINTKGLTATNLDNVTTFNIDKVTGDVSIRGLLESMNYSDLKGSEKGYRLTSDGDAFINNAIVRGSVILPNSGITDSVVLSDGEESKHPVRFWAGESYENRGKAPFRVLQDGSIYATKGDFSGTFTGKLSVGNIYIEDSNTSNGYIAIKNNDNTQTLVHLEEKESFIKSNLTLGEDLIRFDSENNTVSVNGKQTFVKGKNTFIINDVDALVKSTDGLGEHKQHYDNGTYNFTSTGKLQNGQADYNFGKVDVENAAEKSVKVDVKGELYVKDKITMNNNIAIVSRQDEGNSGFDYVVR
ncbi:phage tail spike protein [Clostridium sp.]|uniref:phage tail spike protein n=1 Tax=Clostridium sp. TaxID=1506 RepID=UPI002FC58B4F